MFDRGLPCAVLVRLSVFRSRTASARRLVLAWLEFPLVEGDMLVIERLEFRRFPVDIISSFSSKSNPTINDDLQYLLFVSAVGTEREYENA